MDQSAMNPGTDDISLTEYFALLKRRRWLILSFIAACTIASAAAGFLLPTKYTAVIVVAPVTHSSGTGQMGNLSSLASQFSGLASLAGISIGEDTQRAETLAVLQSNALTERYISANNLLPILYAKLWDAKTRQWTTSNPEKVPTLWKASRFFRKKIRAISTDEKSGIVTMKITWTNAQDAANWANGLVAMTNDYLRARAIKDAQQNIAYLNAQAATTTLVPERQAISDILETQIDKEMLARGAKDYALKILDPAQPPQLPSSLKPLTWILIGLLGSSATGLLVAFFRLAWGRSG